MGLNLKPTHENKIYIRGTNIELDDIYVRVVFEGEMCGERMAIRPYFYQNKDAYIENHLRNRLPIDIKLVTGSIGMRSNELLVNIEEDEEQSINTALIYLRDHFISIGYDCTLEDEPIE